MFWTPLLFPFIGLFFFSSCTPHSLSVQTDFLRREQLASYHVNTPDPMLNEPLLGQRLMVNWKVPPYYLHYPNLHLRIVIRFLNRTQLIKEIPIDTPAGIYIYVIQNEEFLERKGFLTYKVEMIGDNFILKEWQHQLWTELIKLDICE